jgi:RNA polymerase sigma-70 factor (sigma-E family)
MTGGAVVLFEEYVAARGAALLRFAYLLTGEPHTAEDLTQTALTKAYRHWRRVTRADHPDAYVRRILVTTFLSWTRRRAWQELPLAPGGHPLTEAVADVADAIAGHDAFLRLLDSLNPRPRAVLVLRYYADLDDPTIADLLGIAPSTVRATAARALATLRQNGAAPHVSAAEDNR